MSSIKFNAKNVEIWIAKADSDFDPSDKGNDTTLASYFDAQITAGNVTDVLKISDGSNEFSIEPAEDDSEVKKYYGSDSNGAQNSETLVTDNPEVDITLTRDDVIEDNLDAYSLTKLTQTHASVDDYESYVMGTKGTDTLVLFARVKRLVNSVYYFKNYCILNPVFTTPSGYSASADDTVAEIEYTWKGSKAKIFKDHYNDSSDETLSALEPTS